MYDKGVVLLGVKQFDYAYSGGRFIEGTTANLYMEHFD